MDARKAVELLAIIGVGVFVLVVILSVIYQGYANTQATQLAGTGYTITQQGTTNSVVSINMIAANSLTITSFTGGYSWISAGNPLTVTITGLGIKTYAVPPSTNPINSPTFNTLVFQVTSTATPVTLLASTSEFYSINTITLTGFTGTAGAFPDIGLTVSQASNTLALQPTITANVVANVLLGSTFGAYYNFTTYGAPLANTYGSNLGLAITALVLFIVIAIIAGLFLNNKGGGVLGG